MKPADWIVEKRGQHQERDQVADLHRAVEHRVTSKPEHDHRTDRFEHRHRRRVNRPDPHHHESGVPQLIAYAIEPGVLLFLARKTLDLANPGQVIVQKRVHRRGRATLQTITPMRGQGVSQRARDQKRERNQREQRELGIEIKHHAENDHHLKDRDHALLDPID